MSEMKKDEGKLITDIFVDGAKKGWGIAVNSIIPNVLMAYVIIFMLKTSGILDLMGKYMGFIVKPLGLPGEALAALLAAFLSWGGGAGAVGALFNAGLIELEHVAILIPGMALIGSIVQYMGRILGVLGIPSRHFPVLFLICILNAYMAMFVMRLLIKL